MPKIDLAALAPPTNPNVADFGPGDSVRVELRVVEGERERVQPFEGVVLKRDKGPAATFTVRRLAGGIGGGADIPPEQPATGERYRHAAWPRAPRPALLPARPHRPGPRA